MADRDGNLLWQLQTLYRTSRGEPAPKRPEPAWDDRDRNDIEDVGLIADPAELAAYQVWRDDLLAFTVEREAAHGIVPGANQSWVQRIAAVLGADGLFDETEGDDGDDDE
jgi:hypothetical protein